MTHFELLTTDEIQLLEEAIPLIAVLIAGADGHIQISELDWAAKLTHIRSYSGLEDLREFYKQIDANFKIKFEQFVKFLPTDTDTRQKMISDNLSKLNPILQKLDSLVAFHLYTSYKTYAKSIADASGNILGFHYVLNEEKPWLNLPMINPIAEPK